MIEKDKNKDNYTFFTNDVKNQWLQEYVNNGYNIKTACAIVGISTNTFYAHLRADEAFKSAYEESNNIALNSVLSVLLEGLNHEDWNIRRWSVERLMKSSILKKYDLSEIGVTQSQSNIVVNKEDITLE